MIAMSKKSKLFDEAVKEFFIRVYKESTPKVDFQKVLDEASKLHDEGKESTFDYNKYYLADSRQHEIMDEILSKKEYKFIKKESYYYNGYIMQTMLGPSPTTVDPNKK